MSDIKDRLRIKLHECSDVDEQASLLAELAELSLSEGKPAEAQLLYQQAYDIRLKGAIAACSVAKEQVCDSDLQKTAVDTGRSTTVLQSAQWPAPAAAAAVRMLSSSTGGDWDRSDDWEPDLTALRKASSWQQEGATAATMNGQVEQEADALPGKGGSWRSGSSGSAVPSSSSQRPGSADGLCSSSGRAPEATPPRPRGRGESRLDATSDSDTEWDSILGVPNQPHIVELFGLNRGVKTSHLDQFLLDYMWGGTTANLKWVDDEHALAVFPSAEGAQQLLNSPQTRYKVRPYSKASGGALQISAEELTAPRSARPQTTTAVARRLISNALGNREVRDRAAERELSNLRKANKQERQQRQQQMESVWGDDD